MEGGGKAKKEREAKKKGMNEKPKRQTSYEPTQLTNG